MFLVYEGLAMGMQLAFGDETTRLDFKVPL